MVYIRCTLSTITIVLVVNSVSAYRTLVALILYNTFIFLQCYTVASHEFVSRVTGFTHCL